MSMRLKFFKNVGNLPVLDKDGYRFNVGIVLVNALGQVFGQGELEVKTLGSFHKEGLIGERPPKMLFFESSTKKSG